MPFGEREKFENPSMSSIEKPEKIEKSEPSLEKKIEPTEEIKTPEKEEPIEAGDSLKLEQIRGELKRLQGTEVLEKTSEEKELVEQPHEDPRKFLEFEKLTQSSDDIKKLAERFRSGGELQKVEKILSFLGEKENLNHVDLERENPKEWKKLFRNRTAEEIFESKTSYGCTDTTSLFLAVVRECGIPAKFIEGKRLGKSGTHSWVQVLVKGKWVDVDPTQGVNGMEFKPEESKHGPYKIISESLGPSDSMITSHKDWKKIEKAWDYKKNAFKKETK